MPEQHPDASKRNAKGHWIGSGNPTGRPSTASRYRGLLLSRVPELIEKAIAMALEGDTAALRLCLDKALPNLKPRATPEPIDLPGESFKDKLNGLEFLLSAGEITVDEFTALVAALSNGVKLIEADELRRRVEALEARMQAKP